VKGMGLLALPRCRKSLILPHALHLNTSLILDLLLGILAPPGGSKPLILLHVPHLNALRRLQGVASR
jgi:hypothetical protein